MCKLMCNVSHMAARWNVRRFLNRSHEEFFFSSTHIFSPFGSLVDPSLQACKTRAVLTEAQAVEIFLIKIANDDVPKRSRRSAAAVARCG